MKSLLLASAALAVSAGLPAIAFAEASPNKVDELVVTATRSPERADRVGQQVTVITAAELREQQTPILSDILTRVPGVNFSRNGGVGTATSVYLRGAEPGQTLVLIDGVQLNDPTATDSATNFGNLLLGDIDRVEVLRGVQSVLWGSQAIGGVINLLTAEPQAPFESDLTVEGGSHAWGYVRGGIGGKTDRVAWRVTAANLTTTGISDFDGGREADGYHNARASAKARVSLTDQFSLDLRAVYSRGRTDFDGFAPPTFSLGDTPEYGVTEDLVGYAGANLDLLDGRLRNRVAVTGSRTGHKNFDPTQSPDVTFSGLGRNERIEYQGAYDLSRDWTAVFGAERKESHMHSASTFSPVLFKRSSRVDSVYLQVHGDVVPGLTLSGGVRRDDDRDYGGHTVGEASAAWRLNEGNTILRASWGEGFKAPSLYQLGSEYGNPDLKPESAKSWDVGVEQRLLDGRVVVTGAYFERRTRDQIDFVSCWGGPAPLCPTHPSGGYYDNIAHGEAHGVELSALTQLTEALSLDANYTWTNARNDAADSANFGKRLARRPVNQANAQATYRWPVKLETAVAVRYASDRFNDAANLTKVKGYVLWDLRASYPVTDKLEVYGRVENLFDKHYETIANYGQLGRAAYAGVRARF